ncbi:PAS domain-containing protein [Sphingobium limneticum]|uniref:PAS domain-containing protein n=1 Tax=Sphingobium limneticum TaxID=1007511 RepID=A0A5J5I271_9SPHN|nr:PAS domain-containing protein [Sphingobium limneticum]KAA9016297.1 PAS domain-containing protein [Sphingobium limneticum]KAA9028866.1 PAS domain-containing protein [Sphingobium limneticum]
MLDDRRRRSVPAAELVRNFAHWREVGSREPVMVTHHGRETHVFMGLDRFRTMAVGDDEAPAPDRTFELAARMHQGLVLCGPDLAITYVNGVALAMAKRWDRDLEGQSLWNAFPELAGSLTEAHIRHSLSSGEASGADIPSPFRDDVWLHVQTFPFAGGVALLLRDITADMQRHRLADVKSAILKAMGVHGGVGYVRVSMRGFIEVVNDSFCAMVGLAADRLADVPIADLVELPSRPLFRERLERVLRGEGDMRFATQLLTNEGVLAPVDAAIARLHGIYGTEGAVIVVTSHSMP